MSAPKPWTNERRATIKRKIDKEASRVAARIGASTVAIVACFRDGEFMHMQDGGSALMPMAELYKMAIRAHDIMKASGGQDVKLQ